MKIATLEMFRCMVANEVMDFLSHYIFCVMHGHVIYLIKQSESEETRTTHCIHPTRQLCWESFSIWCYAHLFVKWYMRTSTISEKMLNSNTHIIGLELYYCQMFCMPIDALAKNWCNQCKHSIFLAVTWMGTPPTFV